MQDYYNAPIASRTFLVRWTHLPASIRRRRCAPFFLLTLSFYPGIQALTAYHHQLFCISSSACSQHTLVLLLLGPGLVRSRTFIDIPDHDRETVLA